MASRGYMMNLGHFLRFGPLTLFTVSWLWSEFVQIRLVAQKKDVTKKSKTQGVMLYKVRKLCKI